MTCLRGSVEKCEHLALFSQAIHELVPNGHKRCKKGNKGKQTGKREENVEKRNNRK